jgi:hypothetical protein
LPAHLKIFPGKEWIESLTKFNQEFKTILGLEEDNRCLKQQLLGN